MGEGLAVGWGAVGWKEGGGCILFSSTRVCLACKFLDV